MGVLEPRDFGDVYKGGHHRRVIPVAGNFVYSDKEIINLAQGLSRRRYDLESILSHTLVVSKNLFRDLVDTSLPIDRDLIDYGLMGVWLRPMKNKDSLESFVKTNEVLNYSPKGQMQSEIAYAMPNLMEKMSIIPGESVLIRPRLKV